MGLTTTRPLPAWITLISGTSPMNTSVAYARTFGDSDSVSPAGQSSGWSWATFSPLAPGNARASRSSRTDS